MPATRLMQPEPAVEASTPVLNGYTFEPERAYQARDRGRLLTLQIETNDSCNLNCRYCYAGSSPANHREADFSWLAGVIRQAQRLGAESIVVSGGEPTMHPEFRNLVAFIDELGMTPVVFTNALTMSRNLALHLSHHNASVICKYDSPRPWVQDFLAKRPGALDLFQRGMRNLRDMGFTTGEGRKLRMGVACVVNRLNLADVETIWRFARENRIYPLLEPFVPAGRGGNGMNQYLPSGEEIRAYKLRLLRLDREEYGYDWLPYPPLAAGGCLQHLCSMHVTLDGDVRPCALTQFDSHSALMADGRYPYNLNRMSLESIYQSNLFTYVRSIDRQLEGNCRDCDHLDQCAGCRGFAYTTGVREGLDPLDALRQECGHCFKNDTRDWFPMEQPMEQQVEMAAGNRVADTLPA